LEDPNIKTIQENEALFGALVQRIEEICLRGPVKSWTQRDFIYLSEAIQEKTGDPLSVTTLKRILGKIQYQGLPYPNTLSLLARFCGFAHWEEFKSAQLSEMTTISEAKSIQRNQPEIEIHFPKRPVTKSSKFQQIYWLRTTILLAIAFGAGWWLADFRNKEDSVQAFGRTGGESSGRLEYSMKDSLFPREVTFAYSGPVPDPADLTVITCESGKMQYFQINPEGFGQSSYLYEQPGLYHAKVFSNNRQLAFSPVLVESEDWLVSARVDNKDFNLIKAKPKNDELSFSTKDLSKAGIDTFGRFHSRMRQFKDYGYSGDSLSFSIELQNQAVNNENRDQLVSIRLRCGNYPLIIQLARWMPRDGFFVQISEKLFETPERKKFNNLIQPLDHWQKLTIKTFRNQTQVWLGDKELLREKFKLPYGSLLGIELDFVGKGSFRNLNLEKLTKN
jgi:hypothetical protein